MQKAVSVVADNFNTMRTGRANPAILDRIVVSCRSGAQSTDGSLDPHIPAVWQMYSCTAQLTSVPCSGGSVTEVSVLFYH
jgi:hypothetical protein